MLIAFCHISSTHVKMRSSNEANFRTNGVDKKKNLMSEDMDCESYEMSVFHLPFQQVHSQEFLGKDVGKCLRVIERRLQASYVPGVRSQDSCLNDASCVPLAFLSAMEGAYCMQNCLDANDFARDNTFTTSVENLVKVEQLLDHVQRVRFPNTTNEEGYFLRVKDHIFRNSSDLTHSEIIDMLRGYGPLVAIMDLSEDIMLSYPFKKIIYSAMGNFRGVEPHRHAVIITGWGEVADDDYSVVARYLICQNNWDKQFGEDGVFRVWMEVNMDIVCFKSFESHLPEPEEDES